MVQINKLKLIENPKISVLQPSTKKELKNQIVEYFSLLSIASLVLTTRETTFLHIIFNKINYFSHIFEK